MHNAQEEAEDSGLTFALNYYSCLSLPAREALTYLQNLYAEQSVLSYNGARFLGRQARRAHLFRVQTSC